jgi:hypothetical protein
MEKQNQNQEEKQATIPSPPPQPDVTSPPPSEDVRVMQATIERLQHSIREAEQREKARDQREQAREQREQARLRDLRRISIGVPSSATPGLAVSSLTDPFVESLYSSTPTQQGRRSLKAAFVEANDDEDDGEEEDDPRQPQAGAQVRHVAPSSKAAAERQAIINKALTKIPSPGRFAGKDDNDKDNCENWCKQMTNYLNGLFRGITDAHAERMQIVIGLLDQPASDWMNGVYREEDNMSWEQILPAFIEYIQGGRDRRALWKEKMEALAYGRGKCKDLLQFDHQFETLRIKLYPSSSANTDMNRRSADDYGAAIRRGDPHLYIECVRLLGRDYEEANLSTWKKVAQQAVAIRTLTREMRSTHDNGTRGLAYRPPQQPQHFGRSAVQHMHTDEVGEGGEEDIGLQEEVEEPSPQVQSISTGRRMNGAAPYSQNKEGVRLSEDMRRQIMAKGLCFSCYKRGHRARDTGECPNKGRRATRPPTAEELKA